MRGKIESYMSFAARSRTLFTGYNTCLFMMAKGKLSLLILAEDLSENSKDKMQREAAKSGLICRIYGTSEALSHETGNEGKGIFGIADKNLADAIINEIDRRSKEEEVF